MRRWRTLLLFCIALAALSWRYQVLWNSSRYSRYREVDLKELSLIELDQQAGRTQDIPSAIRQFNGQQVVIIGEMYTG